MLRRFGILSGTHLRKCSQKKLNILFILRRDYKNHPRNLAGIIDRKIANEEDVLKEIKDSFPTADITPVQLDLLPIKSTAGNSCQNRHFVWITIPGGVSSRLLRMAIDSICSSSKHKP